MKKRVMVISDCPTLKTGYARIGRFVAQTMHNADYEVVYVPCNATSPDKYTFDYTVYSFVMADRYNNRRIPQLINDFKPGLIIVMGEFGYVGYLGNIGRQMNVQTMYYMPVEGPYYPPAEAFYPGGQRIDFRIAVAKFNFVVAYSEFGKKEIHRQLPGIVHEVIYHPVDTKIFRPMDKKALRDQFFPQFKELNDKGKLFLAGAVYRNSERKGIDYLLKGFKYFLDNYEDKNFKEANLVLVMDLRETKGYNVMDLIERYGLQGRIANIEVTGGIAGPEDNQLAEIYNLFDTHVCPFRAEGFGLPILESLACGNNLVCTDFATPPEYAGSVAHLIPVWDTVPRTGTNCEWAVLDYKQVGEAIRKSYLMSSDEHNVDAVDAAHKCSEEVIAKQWLELLNDVNIPEMPTVEKLQGTVDVDAVVEDYFDTVES